MSLEKTVFFSLVMALASITSAVAQEPARYYASGSFAADFLKVEGSGFNTAGGFNATGIDHETNEGFSLALGRESDLGDYQIRLESQFLFFDDSQFTLNSFPGPPAPSTFFYRGAITDRWAYMTNLWIDKPISDNFEVYAGGGLGVSMFELSQTDNVVSSVKDDDDIAYQFGVGVTCKLLSNVELDLGYRRMDLGNANTALTQSQGQFPAGNLNVNMDSDQLALTLRIYRR